MFQQQSRSLVFVLVCFFLWTTQVHSVSDKSRLMHQVAYACGDEPYTCVGSAANMVCTCDCIETSFVKGNLQSVWICDPEPNLHCLSDQNEIRVLIADLRAVGQCACDESGCSCIQDDCCWYESYNGFYTPHDSCNERRLNDQVNVQVGITNPGDSVTNATYSYIDIVLEDVDTAVLSQQTTISSSYQKVVTHNYGSHFRERVSTGQTTYFTFQSFIECGFNEAVYEMHMGKPYFSRTPITLLFTHSGGSTPTKVVDVLHQGMCSKPPLDSINHCTSGGSDCVIEATTTEVSTTFSICSDGYTPDYISSSGYSLYRLNVGNSGDLSYWSRLLYKAERDDIC